MLVPRIIILTLQLVLVQLVIILVIIVLNQAVKLLVHNVKMDYKGTLLEILVFVPLGTLMMAFNLHVKLVLMSIPTVLLVVIQLTHPNQHLFIKIFLIKQHGSLIFYQTLLH